MYVCILFFLRMKKRNQKSWKHGRRPSLFVPPQYGHRARRIFIPISLGCCYSFHFGSIPDCVIHHGFLRWFLMPKPKWWKKLTQNFTRATQCGFNFNSISFYSFTSIDSCRQGKRCCCVTSETLQCRSSDRPLENLKYHKVMKRIRKKRSFMMRVLFIEMVDITTPGLSSAVCVFVNFRHRDTAVSAVVPFFL